MMRSVLTPDAVTEFLAEHYKDAHFGGLRCEAIGEGFAVTRWVYDKTRLRPGGFISGPTQFAAADVALWFLTFTVLGLAPMAVTSDMSITFLRPAVGPGDLIARAELMRAGKTRINGRVTLWIEGREDKIVSHATGSYSVPG